MFGSPEKCKTFNLQMPSYSTYNSLSYSLGACCQIWAIVSLSSPTQNMGFSRGPEILNVVEAMKAKEEGAIAKAISKKKEVATKAIKKIRRSQFK